MNNYYTYLWLREDGTPYYAGKGKGDRAFIIGSHIINPPNDKEKIILQEWPDEQTAFEAEKFLIAVYGRIDLNTGCLHNMSDGGEGQSGFKHTLKTKQKISQGMKGKKNSLGIKHTIETRIKHRNYKHTKEAKDKIIKALINRPVSKETRLKIRNAKLGKPLSAEHKHKISESKRKHDL